MARITEECVARIKDAADVVDLVGRFVQLRRAGNSWKACCPFHAEKTPSFHVNPARQTFHCFGCGVGGDAVKFVMMFENLDYPTALRRVADMYGVTVVEEEENPEMARLRRIRARVVEANTLAAEYFHKKLCRDRAADHVRAYLTKREFGIEIAKAWQLGWAPADFRELAQLAHDRGIDDRLLAEAYLLGRGQRGLYPVFRDRLMFPICNVRGEVVGFSGRIMEEGQDPRKYVNTAETAAFRKGELLFGLYKATGPIAKAGMCVVVCEGQLDVIACHEKADIRNAVAGLGTAFTDDHAKILRKYAKKAILCYDGDNAGIKASEKTFRKLAAAGLEVYHAALPAGEDPDSLIRTQGADALRAAIDSARPYLEVRVELEKTLVKDDVNARAALIPRMADLAAEIADPNRRDVSVVDLATRLNTGLDELRTSVNDIIRARKDAPPSFDQRRPAAPVADAGYGYPEEEFSDFSEPEPMARPVVPIRLHPAIRGLISFAAGNKEAQHLLIERIEDLQEPIRALSGGIILQRLMEQLPEPGNAEAWQQFVASLPPEQAAALRDIDNTAMPLENVSLYVEQACNRAARDTVKATIDSLKSRIRSGNISAEEAIALMKECTDLQKMLDGDV